MVVLAAILLSSFLFLRWFEYSNVYHPSTNMEETPESFGLNAREVWLKTSDGARIHAWFFPATNTNGPARGRRVILYAHGNAGNMSHRFDTYQMLLQTGSAVFTFDYRGFGKSSGWPGEKKTYLDADAAMNWLKSEGFDSGNIFVMGESLGGGIATETALRHRPAGLVLLSTFTSIPDIGAELFPWLPTHRLASIRYDTHRKLPGLQCPVLILHSREDGLIGYHHAERNFAAAREPKKFVTIAGTHNDSLQTDGLKIRLVIQGFIDDPSPSAGVTGGKPIQSGKAR